MARQFFSLALIMTLCLAVSLAQGAQRGKQGGGSRGGQGERKPEGRQNTAARGGKSSPGGEWSERTHGGKQSNAEHGNAPKAAGAAAGKNNASQNSGKKDAAAGAAASNRKAPQASGAEGAAAGAAAANRKAPQASGAQGAAAGAAAENRKAPQYSGAQGAAAGAAAANRNEPKYSGAQGAAAGAAVANRNEPAVSGAAGAAAGYAGVRNSFNNSGLYSAGWYGAHAGVWAPAGLAVGAAWTPSAWGAVAGYCGYGANPTSYNYGVNVNAQDGNVLVDGQNVGTTAEFSQQAADLAETGANAQVSDTDKWLPLGVFAMVRNEQQHPQLILQMAINKDGILRGNYTDELTDHTLPIHGAVDKQTQRAAWTVGGNKQTVMEAGLSDLTEGEAPALIHKNGKTDHWILIRLDQPKPADAGDSGAARDKQ